MLRATLKSLLARKLRLILSGFAVVLGVMAVASALILGSTLNKSVDGLFGDIYDSIDVQVKGKTFVDAESQGGISVSQPIPAGLVEQLRSIDDAETVTGEVVEDGARVVGTDGKVITSNGPPRLGESWAGEDEQTQLREGRGPQAANEVAINVPLAQTGDFSVGDNIDVLTREPKKPFTVVGIYGVSDSKASFGGETSVSFTEPVAQQLMLGEEGVYSVISLTAKDGVDQQQLRDQVANAVGDNYIVQTGEQASEEEADSLQGFVSLFQNVLLGFAAVALFVGIFLILNTFSIIVAQRTKELALFRAMGASRGQVIRSVMLEAIVVGLIASTLGFAAGIGIAKALLTLLGNQNGGAELFDGAFTIPVSAVIASYLVGVIVTLIAALVPALRASRIPPVAALRDAELTQRPLTRLTIIGAVPAVLGIGCILLTLFGDAPVVVLLVGVLLVFIGVAMLAPAITRPVVNAIGWLLSWSLPGKLGRRNAARNPRRTAITASALMIGLALVTGVSVVASSLTATIERLVEQDIKAQLFVAADSFGGGPLVTFDPAVAEQTRKLPGVTAVAEIYGDLAEVKGQPQFITAVDPNQSAEVSDITALSGRLDDLGSGRVLIDDGFATSNNLEVGEEFEIATTRGGPRDYTVAAVYEKTEVSRGTIMSVADAKQYFGRSAPFQAAIVVGDDGSVSTVKKQVTKLLEDNPEVSVQNQDEVVKQASGQIDQFLLILYVLLGLAIVIAVLGIINTLALSILERTRELGLLRAVGLSRRKTRWMITTESIVISVFGSLLGMAVGCGLGALVVTALEDEGFSELAFPWARLALFLALAVIVGLLAAIIPAFRASRVNVLRAIAYE